VLLITQDRHFTVASMEIHCSMMQNNSEAKAPTEPQEIGWDQKNTEITGPLCNKSLEMVFLHPNGNPQIMQIQ